MPQLLKFLRYFLLGRAQRIFGAQALTALLLLGFGASVWTSLRTNICKQETYIVKERDFCVWNPPVWISDAFVAEALELRAPEARTDELNSLDPNLVDNLLFAFESHPWVEEVESIEIRFPARVDVKLKFKTPVAAIDPTPAVAVDWTDSPTPNFNDDGEKARNGQDGAETEDAQNGEDGQDSKTRRIGQSGEKYIIDANGYRLPDEYFRKNPNAYRAFPVVLGIGSTPVSGFGQCGDPLVVEAAAFADFLRQKNAFEKLKIDRILVEKIPGEAKGAYCLKTVEGTVVVWGRFAAPTGRAEGATNKNDEASGAFEARDAKLERLFQLAEKYGALDAVPAEKAGELNLSDEPNAAAANAENGEPSNAREGLTGGAEIGEFVDDVEETATE